MPYIIYSFVLPVYAFSVLWPQEDESINIKMEMVCWKIFCSFHVIWILKYYFLLPFIPNTTAEHWQLLEALPKPLWLYLYKFCTGSSLALGSVAQRGIKDLQRAQRTTTTLPVRNPWPMHPIHTSKQCPGTAYGRANCRHCLIYLLNRCTLYCSIICNTNIPTPQALKQEENYYCEKNIVRKIVKKVYYLEKLPLFMLLVVRWWWQQAYLQNGVLLYLGNTILT